ncbi:LysM peptidoglycan-binding domain-containing protein [Runella slithyformis]|uniref:Peptidoglycan-binding lysin domain protein n=1 Tax=Runella slithyformis (strain ATCC 29530 / DSM 19594 / LMG 11500 / NCIMB 11436 / LSU 4) TaxID=761193 RepID=A0A7U3ZQX6_RUNSL|nr:LysM domain-containing protein [Runella slithyformis]AEI51737.1 Peptidoglycan-binding lysin domain protein [Runella slithyformis DSM 19594]
MSENENRNRRPEESSKLPYLSLGVLVLMIAGLLYVGYEYIADDAADVDQLLNTPLDTTGRELQPIPYENNQLTTTSPTTKDNTETEAKEDKVTAATQEEDLLASPTPRPADEEEPKKAEEKVPEKPKETAKPVAVNPGGIEITHTVQSGETFYGIANRYNLKSGTLKGINPDIKDENTDVKSGVTRIKVRVQAVHTVGPGDILRVVAEKYGITVQQLMAANKKTKNFTERGEKLIIPFPEKK